MEYANLLSSIILQVDLFQLYTKDIVQNFPSTGNMEEWNKGIKCETLEEQASSNDKRLPSSLQSCAEGEGTKKRTAPAKRAQQSSQTAAHP